MGGLIRGAAKALAWTSIGIAALIFSAAEHAYNGVRKAVNAVDDALTERKISSIKEGYREQTEKALRDSMKNAGLPVTSAYQKCLIETASDAFAQAATRLHFKEETRVYTYGLSGKRQEVKYKVAALPVAERYAGVTPYIQSILKVELLKCNAVLDPVNDFERASLSSYILGKIVKDTATVFAYDKKDSFSIYPAPYKPQEYKVAHNLHVPRVHPFNADAEMVITDKDFQCANAIIYAAQRGLHADIELFDISAPDKKRRSEIAVEYGKALKGKYTGDALNGAFSLGSAEMKFFVGEETSSNRQEIEGKMVRFLESYTPVANKCLKDRDNKAPLFEM